jgi:hypothetical protein
MRLNLGSAPVKPLGDVMIGGTMRDSTAIVYEPTSRALRLASLGALLLGLAALIFAVAILVWVIWMMAASVTATPFDADGVRCYHRAVQIACLKTANP